MIRELKQFFYVLRRNGGAESSNGFQEAALGHLDNIHITFAHNGAAFFMNGIPSLVETV